MIIRVQDLRQTREEIAVSGYAFQGVVWIDSCSYEPLSIHTIANLEETGQILQFHFLAKASTFYF